MEENPLINLMVFYGTGAFKLTEEDEIARVGGVNYTVKDGIIFDAKQLLEDVRVMVEAQKRMEDFEILQPGINKRKKQKKS